MRVQPTLPPRYLRTPDAANFVGLSIRTLEKHRSCGTGPLYRQLGGRIVYAVEDLCAWADLNVRLSTGDGGGIPMPSDPRAYIIRLQAKAIEFSYSRKDFSHEPDRIFHPHP